MSLYPASMVCSGCDGGPGRCQCPPVPQPQDAHVWTRMNWIDAQAPNPYRDRYFAGRA